MTRRAFDAGSVNASCTPDDRGRKLAAWRPGIDSGPSHTFFAHIIFACIHHLMNTAASLLFCLTCH
jgi:hypothetical protein